MSSHFSPGSGRSRRRRLLLLRSPSNSPAEPVAAEDGFEATSVSQPVEPPRIKLLPELLGSEDSVSWLFAGDSYTPKTTSPLAWRTFTSRFTGAVRTSFERPRDLFIDGTFPQSRLSEIVFEFEKRIAKFRPDVCFLSLSLLDAEAKSTDRLEQLLLRFIRWASENGCLLVLQTPPCLPPRSDAELTRLLVFVEAVRGMAAEHSCPLVDHWEHWEAAISREGLPAFWFSAESRTPLEEGHRQLARRLLLDLRLDEIRRAARSVPETAQSLTELK